MTEFNDLIDEEKEMWVVANWVSEDAYSYADDKSIADEYEDWRESFDEKNEDAYIGTEDGVNELILFFAGFGPVEFNFQRSREKCWDRIEAMYDEHGEWEDWFDANLFD